MNTPTFLTIEYKGYFILTASDRTEVHIAADGYGIVAFARSVRGAKCKITRMINEDLKS